MGIALGSPYSRLLLRQRYVSSLQSDVLSQTLLADHKNHSQDCPHQVDQHSPLLGYQQLLSNKNREVKAYKIT